MCARRIPVLVLALLVGVIVVVPASPARAGERDAEVHAIQMRIEVLTSEAEALRKKGRHDAADILMERANAWRRELVGRERERNPLTMEQAERILHGLEMGLEALHALKEEAEYKAVMRVANGLRERMKMARRAQVVEREEEAAARRRRDGDGSRERAVAERRLEIMRVAFEGLMEGKKHDAADRMEHAIHALRLSLQGRRDEEANHIRETAPKVGEQAELLGLAARLYKEWGHAREAKIVGGLAEELAGIARRGHAPKRPGGGEREVLQHRLEILRHAQHAFREAERPDLIEQMGRAVHAYEIALAGRRDEEAMRIRERAPNQEQLAELCGYASHLWAEWGHETKAKALKQLSRELLGRKGEAPRREDAEAKESTRRALKAAAYLENLRQRVHQLMTEVERLEGELEKVGAEAGRAR